MAILPVETIEVEILPRLPVRSLLRFKSVCKSWNSLISSNVFIKSVGDSNHDSVTLIGQRQGYYCGFMGCINGLVFREDSRYVGSYGIKIWNPATKQCMEIEPPDQLFGRKVYLPGFGFDSIADDYKCMYFRVTRKRPLYGYIYSCKARRWSKITRSNFVLNLYPGFTINNTLEYPVIVNGSPFWMITDFNDHVNLRMTVMSVDVGQECFRLLPDLGSSGFTFTQPSKGEYRLLNFRDSPAIMYYSSTLLISGETIDIYVFNENGDNWSKTCFGTFQVLSKVPTSRGDEPMFLQSFRNGDILFSDHETIIYWVDLENYTIKNLGKRGINCGHTYSESLVFIDGMKPFYEQLNTFHFFLRKTKTRAGKRRIKYEKRKHKRNKQDDELKRWNRTNTRA